ncbi:unnamed protein product [Blepharisma stoltei]|uniref:Uncharacterized protein n=1 Tax=Blepharisma stoltei TaxID=1481888 RepID=A0AAU9K2C3_9CILI|nr:unnamed protein product [Blepharisma stoltei]
MLYGITVAVYIKISAITKSQNVRNLWSGWIIPQGTGSRIFSRPSLKASTTLRELLERRTSLNSLTVIKFWLTVLIFFLSKIKARSLERALFQTSWYFDLKPNEESLNVLCSILELSGLILFFQGLLESSNGDGVICVSLLLARRDLFGFSWKWIPNKLEFDERILIMVAKIEFYYKSACKIIKANQ